jgi:hypothetical protein
VYCVNSLFILFVIPGVTQNPVFLGWIPAFAGMTASELMSGSVGAINKHTNEVFLNPTFHHSNIPIFLKRNAPHDSSLVW